MKNLIILLLLAGCTTLSKEDCLTQNWQDYSKESMLNSPSHYDHIVHKARKACSEHGITPDNAALQRGYVDAINELCQSKRIWELALDGKKMDLMLCPSGNRAKLKRVYDAGQYLHQIEKLEKDASTLQGKIANLQQESYNLEDELDQLYRSGGNQVLIDSKRRDLASKREEVAKEQNNLASLNLKIGQMRRRARTFDQVM